MRKQYLGLAAAFAAALTLSACGGDDEEPAEDAATIDEGEPAMDAGAPAMDAGAPAMDAGAPAMDAGAPAMDAGAPAGEPVAGVTLANLVGIWAETPEQCGTDAEIIIAPDAITMGDEACIVTGAESVEGGLAVDLLCPVADAEPTAVTWTIAAFGDAPYTDVTITDEDGGTTALVACAPAE